MKRIAVLLAPALMGLTIAGCGGGIEEGHPTSGPMEAQPADFKAFQKEFAGKMKMQKRPTANQKAATATPATDATKETKGEP